MFNAFIINPNAGKGRAARILINKIKSFFTENGGDYEIFQTEKEGDATKIARRLCNEQENVNIFACGGDGTTFEVLNGLVGYKNANLGIIPCGSGNDFVKYFNGREAFGDLHEQMSGSPVTLDLIKMNDLYSLNSCSVGMDAMVADNVRLFKKLPISAGLAYILSVGYTAFKKFDSLFDITIDGRSLGKTDCLFAVCANAPYYGGGFKCAPDACPGDNKLNYSIIKSRSKLHIFNVLGKYRKGLHTSLKDCYYGNCETMEIVNDKTVTINLDGEIVYDNHAKFEIVKNAVDVILPKRVYEEYKSILSLKRRELIKEI